MEKYGDTLYNFKDKINVLLNIRVEQDKRDANSSLDKLTTEVRSKLGFFIDIGIDWQFTSHPSFTSKALDDQTKLVRSLHQNHLPRILNSNDG